MLRDFLQNEIKVGDWIIYLRTYGTKYHYAKAKVLDVNEINKSVRIKAPDLSQKSVLLNLNNIIVLTSDGNNVQG